MFIVATMKMKSNPIQRITVVARQAGGCTSSELPKENLRMLRRAAAKQTGRFPLEYDLAVDHGAYESRDAAEAIANAIT